MEVEEKVKKRKRSKNKGSEGNSKGNTKVKKVAHERKVTQIGWYACLGSLCIDLNRWNAFDLNASAKGHQENRQPPQCVSTRGRELLQNLMRFDSMVFHRFTFFDSNIQDEFENQYWLKKPYLKQLNENERAALQNLPHHPLRMLSMDDIKYIRELVSLLILD
jgi:hypothetical protein